AGSARPRRGARGGRSRRRPRRPGARTAPASRRTTRRDGSARLPHPRRRRCGRQSRASLAHCPGVPRPSVDIPRGVGCSLTRVGTAAPTCCTVRPGVLPGRCVARRSPSPARRRPRLGAPPSRSPRMIDLHYWPTPNGHKVTLLLEEAGLDYRIHPVDIGKGAQFEPDFLAISPNNKMPAIVDHAPADGGAPQSVFESGAILLYLAEKTGRFLPTDPRGRIEAL